MKRRIILLLLSFIFASASANNISVSNLSLSGQNVTSHFSMVNFDLNWENSWRTNVGPSNWDAAWVFAKYRLKTSNVWNHATLNWVNGTGSADGHVVPGNATIFSSNDNGSNGSYGVFIYSNALLAQQSVAYPGVSLRWNYGVDGVSDADSVEICLFAIEMVYVPQGSFYVGDGNLTSIGQFRTQPANVPFQITSEGSITLGGASPTALLSNGGMNTPDDFTAVISQTLPVAFPKGYNAYYVMKYEISQDQYVQFLNKLTRVQQANRFSSTTVGNFLANGAAVTPQNRNGIKLMSDPGGLEPRVFGCDLNNNGTPDEAADGQNIACNWISTVDVLAYLDWAALRPMTELEFEKAGRGPLLSLSGEYSWGSTVILGATSISNPGANNEVAGNVGANTVYNNAGGVTGPMRVGSFAQSATSRIQAGAGYYGILDLTGNVWEDVVLVGSNAGRSYTGLHGNGVINTAGAADVNFWPGINGNNTPATANSAYAGTTGCTGYAGISFTGGTWNAATWMTLSDRAYRGTGWNGVNGRDTRNGGRGVRTAP